MALSSHFAGKKQLIATSQITIKKDNDYVPQQVSIQSCSKARKLYVIKIYYRISLNLIHSTFINRQCKKLDTATW